MGTSTSRIAPSLLGALLCAPVSAQLTQRVSVSSSEVQGNGPSGFYAQSISANGRFVAFQSGADNLVPGDTNGVGDIFVRDRQSGTTERVSVGTGGAEGNSSSDEPSISADGRFVAFRSGSNNLVAGDPMNGANDIFVHDRRNGTTELVSFAPGGSSSTYDNRDPSISADGRYVAFAQMFASSSNQKIIVRDRQSGTTDLVSVNSHGLPANRDSGHPSISADGRFVAFWSIATNLVDGDTNGNGYSGYDVFVHDRSTGTTERVNVDSSGVQADDLSASSASSISADGHYVAFYSNASNLVRGDTNGVGDIFVRDRQLGTTVRVSVASDGSQAAGPDYFYSHHPSISADGRFVSFDSSATNLVSGDTNGFRDIFVRDSLLGMTERVSVASGGAQGNGSSGGGFSPPSISADGRFVAFLSDATNLVSGDTNGNLDVFVHDSDAAGLTSLCEPGSSGVTACPCSNDPSGPGHGCDDSSATGGATLSASGVSYLSMDSLVFTTNGEKPGALSIVLQGNSLVPSGFVYGQGVHCAGGSLKKLYVKHASGGSITAPEAGDPSVSAQSIALGVPISPGQRRWYFVAYRDPIVLGGCPASNTINGTQTGRVAWSL